MLDLKFRQSHQSGDATVPESPNLEKIHEQLEALHRSDRYLDSLMRVEVWAIAKTMDTLYPGFWNQFMENRRIAFKHLMEQKQAPRLTE